MKPRSAGFTFLTMSRSRRRSLSESILRLTPDLLCPRRQHEVATGDRHVRRDACALRPDRLLRDLDDDLFALGEQRPDVRHVALAAPSAAVAAAFGVVEFLGCSGRSRPRTGTRPSPVRCRRRRPAFRAGLASRDPSRPRLRCCGCGRVQMELDELFLFEDGHPGFARGGVDQDLVLHSRCAFGPAAGCLLGSHRGAPASGPSHGTARDVDTPHGAQAGHTRDRDSRSGARLDGNSGHCPVGSADCFKIVEIQGILRSSTARFDGCGAPFSPPGSQRLRSAPLPIPHPSGTMPGSSGPAGRSGGPINRLWENHGSRRLSQASPPSRPRRAVRRTVRPTLGRA